MFRELFAIHSPDTIERLFHLSSFVGLYLPETKIKMFETTGRVAVMKLVLLFCLFFYIRSVSTVAPAKVGLEYDKLLHLKYDQDNLCVFLEKDFQLPAIRWLLFMSSQCSILFLTIFSTTHRRQLKLPDIFVKKCLIP